MHLHSIPHPCLYHECSKASQERPLFYKSNHLSNPFPRYIFDGSHLKYDLEKDRLPMGVA
jgi:hypothetical protein